MQTLYRFKGNVKTLTELNSKTDYNIGDTWNCEEDGNNYCWNKTEWVNIGTNIDLSSCTTKAELALKADKTELEEKASKKELTDLQNNIETAIQEVADAVVTETASDIQNGLMSKEDKAKLDTLENIEVIQEDGEASTENVYSADAVKELLKNKKDKQQSIITGAEFETRTYN